MKAWKRKTKNYHWCWYQETIVLRKFRDILWDSPTCKYKDIWIPRANISKYKSHPWTSDLDQKIFFIVRKCPWNLWIRRSRVFKNLVDFITLMAEKFLHTTQNRTCFLLTMHPPPLLSNPNSPKHLFLWPFGWVAQTPNSVGRKTYT